MKDDAATSKPTIVVIDGGSAIRDSIEFLLRTVGYHVTGLIVGYHVTGLIK
jgi:FixJ family two-component response regulator